MFQNTLKEKLAAGKAVFGIMANDYSPPILEILGYSGFDWVLLDNEHGTITPESLPHSVRACEASGLVPIVRPVGNRMEIITPFMDQGAYGVQSPHVNTADDARAIVDAVKYPPLGRRGYYGSNRNNRFGLGMPAGDYLAHANRQTMVITMVEEVEGIRNAGEIAAVDGVDVVFMGAGDLSVSMGYPGQMTHPEVVKAVESAVAKVLAAGKVAGCSCPEDQIPFWLDRGVRFFHGSVWALVGRAAREYLERARGAAAKAGAA